MHRFKDLEIWKLSRSFCVDVYKTTLNFPESEKFGLSSRLRRASVSVPSNIAEGCSRKSNKEFGRFLEIAIGSMYEMESQLLVSMDLSFIQNDELELLLSKLSSLIKMTSKFKSMLR